MNTKNGKRSRRRTDDDNSPDYKPPSNIGKKFDEIKIRHDEADELKVVEVGEGLKTRTRSNTPQNPKKSTPPKNDAPKDGNKVEESVIVITENNGKSASETPTNNDTNGVVIEISDAEDTNGVEKDNDKSNLQEFDEMEGLEPLIMGAEDIDPELQFDENSDVDSNKESPVISRCKTRRSQTRNIPTPKTPKSIIEQNGDESDKLSTLTPETAGTPELSPTPELENNGEPQPMPAAQQEEDKPPLPEFVKIDLNETTDSTLSTKVNVGDEFTREIDLTEVADDKDSFLNQNKDLTVVETIRRMSARKSIRQVADYRKGLLKSKAEKQDIPYPSSRASVERLSGTKRKNRSTTPDGVKRYKVENTQGLLSYISSPFSRIKNRFVSGDREVSASTPKLTSYKKQDNILEDADISKIENETSPAEKKWCVIM